MAITELEPEALPRWDVSGYYPSLGSREFAAAHEQVQAGVARLVALYDQHDVRGGEAKTADAATVAAFEEVLAATNDLAEEQRLVFAFVAAHVTTDARDDEANGTYSSLQTEVSPLRVLSSRFDAWVASIGAEALVAASPAAADHAWPLRKAERNAAHQMTEAEEALAAELGLTGGSAWNRLYGDVTARLTAEVAYPDGRTETLPITVVRNLAGEHDPAVREAAYRAELAAWESESVTLAACMNGIKGEACTVNRRRGWEDALAPALHGNAVSRSTLEAMQSAVVASLPDFRRYLKAKARLLGHGDRPLPWWDLFAPVGDPDASAYSWADATDEVHKAFSTYSPSLAGLVERAVAESWIDAEARDGKRGGAFCMGTTKGESRVLMNFAGTFDSVSTLAHELGHAYHNTTLAERTPMQRATPMALAETASIFCETVLVQSGLASADDARRLLLLETDLLGATQVVVDIHSRFLFEREVFEKRAAKTLSVADLNGLMLDAQRTAYGDGLDGDALHPYMWAVKPHYYGTAFYNWPYTFGLLFGIGLYARFQEDPDRFRGGYDDLLSSTGLGEASELAMRFGIDVEDEAFWTASLDVLRGRIAEFERLTA